MNEMMMQKDYIQLLSSVATKAGAEQDDSPTPDSSSWDFTHGCALPQGERMGRGHDLDTGFPLFIRFLQCNVGQT